jgi:putative flavoprotein involved in K+ transport
MPRRYRGRDVFWWLQEMGGLDQTIDERGEPRPNPLVTGAKGGHDIDLRRYALDGMALCGHVRDVSGERLTLAPDMIDEIERGERAHAGFTRMVDEYVARTGLDAPPAPAGHPVPPPPEPPLELDLGAAGITSVVWATGFRYDFGWIEPSVLDAAGEPIHRRGVTRCPGLYFLGLPWLWKLKSSVLCGVGEDAEYIAEHIAASGHRAEA